MCSTLKREKAKLVKAVDNIGPCKRDKRDTVCNCSAHQMQCLDNHLGRQSLHDVKLTRTIVLYDIPENITKVSALGRIYFNAINSGIKWDQYSIYRPWPNYRWRKKEVRVEFKDSVTRVQFQNANCGKPCTRAIELNVGPETIKVYWRWEVNEDINQLINKALELKDRFEDIAVYHSHAEYACVQKQKFQWFFNSEAALKTVYEELLEEEKKPTNLSTTNDRKYL